MSRQPINGSIHALSVLCWFSKKRKRKKKIEKLIFKTSYIQHRQASLAGPGDDGGKWIPKRDSQPPERPVILCIPDSTGKTEESLVHSTQPPESGIRKANLMKKPRLDLVIVSGLMINVILLESC